MQHEADFRALIVDGPLDFSAVGVLAALIAPLATAGIPILAQSTFDTDVILVRDEYLPRATQALTDAGHTIS